MSEPVSADPIQPLIEHIAHRVARTVCDQLTQAQDQLNSAALTAGVSSQTEIDLWRPYTASEVGAFIGLSPSRVHGIPSDLLRPTYMGPTGRSKRYIGVNLLAYISGIEPVDVQEVARRIRSQFLEGAMKLPVG